MLIEINKVIVKERIRKDFGDIEELANDIRENGLINPPVVTPEYELIAGERRLRALQHLDYKQIEVRVMTVQDALHQLKLEISENENRKDFSFSEKMKWAEELKNEYSKIAKENIKSTQFGSSDCLTLDTPIGRVDSKIAEELGIGNKDTYRKAQYIYNNADEETIKQLDDGQLSINKAYITLKEQLNKAQQELRVEKNKPREIITETIDNTDYTLIHKLEEQLNKIKRDKEQTSQELIAMTNLAEAYKEDSKAYEKLNSDIDYLTKEKDDLGRKIESITSISALVVDIQYLIKDKLAPVKYSRALLEAKDDEIVKNNLGEIVQIVLDWCTEMKEYIPNKQNYVEIIKGEII